jgi:hypothetical protein
VLPTGAARNHGVVHAALMKCAGELRGRNQIVFLFQLILALLLSVTKILVRNKGKGEPRHAKMGKGKTSRAKAAVADASPIQQVFDCLRRTNPLLPRRRCLDSWCEALFGGLIAVGVWKFPRRKKSQKLPRVTDLNLLLSVTYSDIKRIVARFENMQKLRDFVAPKDPAGAANNTASPQPAVDVLAEALRVLRSASNFGDAQIRLVGEIVAAGAVILKSAAMELPATTMATADFPAKPASGAGKTHNRNKTTGS